MRTICGTILAAAMAVSSVGLARPLPRPALAARLADGPEIIGIVHWGLNTFTDREWGFGDEDPAMLNPAKFDADQIVGACKAGGIGGLVVVAKHHDGFCLWPTKTTEHNITKSPFRYRTSGVECRDYMKAMSDACRRAGLKFGVYCSPWDRNSAHYATEKYVEIYHAQVKELLSGAYGEIFEMWFDGANGGDGWYGGANEKRKIGVAGEYYRFGDVFRFVRRLQPGVTIFSSEEDGSDFRWPGNEQGLLDADSRCTVATTGGYADGKYMNPGYRPQINTGSPDGAFFRVCEADFPLRKGWFYHEKERGTTKSAAYLTKLYLSSVGNAGVMNIGVAPNKEGILDADDVKALAGFKTLKDALFAHEVKQGEPFNVVVMHEDISKGEQVDEWEFVADGKTILRGKSIGLKRIRVLETPCVAKSCEIKVLKDGGDLRDVSFKLYRANPELVRIVLAATTESGETDTAKWMTAEDSGVRVERTYRPARYERGMLNQHICQPVDEAAWIWHPGVNEPQQGCFDIGAFFMSETGAGNEARPAFVRFRRVFSSDGSPFEIDVSADERFVLFLDGKCIARGPNRGWTENWQYQTYTVAVPAGEHDMEAVVMHLGDVAPITQMSCRGGFVLKASGGYDAKLTTGKAQWQAGLLRGTTMGSEFVGHGGMGCRATSTGVGFEDEEPSEWKDAVVVARPIRPRPSRFNWGLRRPGWMLYPSEMPDQTDVERRPGAFRTGPNELSALLSGGNAVIPAGTAFTAYWDLEDYYCYYPELVMSGGKGARVRLSYAEALVDANGKKGDRRAFDGMKVDERSHMYDTFVGDGRADARFTSPWWRCGRWLVLDVSTGDEPLMLESLSIRETRYPCEMESVFQSPDDPTLDAIQRICLRSIQNCAHETLMDCPFYEQQMYPADTRVQMLVLTALSDDDRLVRRCIDIYDLGRRDDGLVPNNWPTRNFQESQVMSLNYLMMYGDFVRWHRNDEWLKARFPGAMNTLLAMKRQENPEGLLEDVLGSPFIDWVVEWGADPIPVGRGEGPGAIVNLYYLHAMKSVADMADAVGEPEIAAHLRKRADGLGRRIVEKFWDGGRGLMSDDVGHTKFSEHAQCFAILGDVLGEAEAKAAFGHLTDGTELARVTVYSLHYLFETFAKFGRGDLILGRFGLWRDYLKAGLSTCLETPVGYRFQRSDCHGWGSHPIYHLRASIAGIRPAAPGFARVRIAPSPGNLRKIRSTMPHPSGTPVEVALEFDGEGGVSGVVKSPVNGEFVWNGRAVPVVAGRETNVEMKGALHGGGDYVWIEAGVRRASARKKGTMQIKWREE